jgi:hypothetical protein
VTVKGGESAKEGEEKEGRKIEERKKGKEKKGFSSQDFTQRTRELRLGMTGHQTTCLESVTC